MHKSELMHQLELGRQTHATTHREARAPKSGSFVPLNQPTLKKSDRRAVALQKVHGTKKMTGRNENFVIGNGQGKRLGQKDDGERRQ